MMNQLKDEEKREVLKDAKRSTVPENSGTVYDTIEQFEKIEEESEDEVSVVIISSESDDEATPIIRHGRTTRTTFKTRRSFGDSD